LTNGNKSFDEGQKRNSLAIPNYDNVYKQYGLSDSWSLTWPKMSTTAS